MNTFPSTTTAQSRAISSTGSDCTVPNAKPGPGHSPNGVLQLLDPLEDAEWDRRVLEYPNHCFFHCAAWAHVLHDSYQQKPFYFGLGSANSPPALLPLTEIRSRLTGVRGVSLPFSDFCPPLGAEAGRFRDSLDAVIAFGRSKGWKYLECRGGRELLPDVPSSVKFLGHTLNLGAGEDRLFAGFESRMRRGIRKAETSEMKIEISPSLEFLEEFYTLHCQTRRKHGLPPQPFSFFETIHRRILAKGQGHVAVARLNKQAIAAAVFFHFGKRVIYKYGASDKASQALRPNNLLMWEAIRFYLRAGFEELHFGRTSVTNEGLRFFKCGFGTEEREIHYLRYDMRSGQFLSGSESGPGWMNKACSFLPLPFLRLAGRILYPHMS